MAPELTNNEVTSKRSVSSSSKRTGLRLAGFLAARNRLVLIFCGLSFIALAANAKLIYDSGRDAGTMDSSSHAVVQGLGNPNSSAGRAGIAGRLSDPPFLALCATMLCFGSMIYLFVSRVVVPLHAISHAAEEMAKGNLSVTAPSYHGDEVGELGHVINNLAVNFQEVLLFTGTTVGNARGAVETIEETLKRRGMTDSCDLEEQIAALKGDLEMLGEVVKDFRFYQAHFDGRKVVPGSPPTKV
jgi:methyl-accepting chemotaxis protein